MANGGKLGGSKNGLNGTWRTNYSGGGGYSNGGTLHHGGGSEWSLAMSPPPSQEAMYTLVRPKNLVQRARMNVAWLDSSLSIMEQVYIRAGEIPKFFENPPSKPSNGQSGLGQCREN